MKYLLIGGTGTLGHAVLGRLLEECIPQANISILSRDEQKQQTMRSVFPDLNYLIGDIRDLDRMRSATFGKDVVVHMAALKHVDILEANVGEAIKTNLLGTMNVSKACQENMVEHCVFSATDKGVLPVNAYGGTKFLAEKYLLSQNKKQELTHFSVFRWGNVIGSRGSVIPIWIRQILSGSPITLTDERMTRFWLTIEDAAAFMMVNYADRPPETMVPHMKAAKLTDVITALGLLLKKSVPPIKMIGVRPGEKIHECIHTSHDKCVNSNDKNIQLTPQDLKGLLSKVVKEYK